MARSAKSKSHTKRHFYQKRWFLITAGSIVGLVLAVVVAFQASPWPGALLIRAVFNQGGSKTLAAMETALPKYPVAVLKDQPYKAHDKDALLDVYAPKSAASDARLPVVVWTHGGGWLSGDKKDAAPYFSRLANQGFVVVSLNYSLAPGAPYPTAVHQLNDAHAYIMKHAAEFKADTNQLVLAGDSAGAQLSSQLAAIITNPAYAKQVGVQPAVQPEQLVGVLLFCGIYRMEQLAEPEVSLPGMINWGDKVTIWAYSGTQDMTDPLIRQMSPYYHVTKDYPDTFITGGNGDALTDTQSKPLADKLSALGVDVTRLFYPKNHVPSLPHEYQFTFNADGEQAFADTVNFLKSKTN